MDGYIAANFGYIVAKIDPTSAHRFSRTAKWLSGVPSSRVQGSQRVEQLSTSIALGPPVFAAADIIRVLLF